MKIEFSIDIARPVAEVFAYVTDPANLPEWQPTTLEVRMEGDGPMGVGTRMTEVRRGPFGRRIESLVEVSEYEPDRRFSLRIVDGPLPVDGAHTFEATPDGARIDFVAEGSTHGALRLAEPLLRRVLARQFRSYYERLKQVLEARPVSVA